MRPRAARLQRGNKEPVSGQQIGFKAEEQPAFSDIVVVGALISRRENLFARLFAPSVSLSRFCIITFIFDSNIIESSRKKKNYYMNLRCVFTLLYILEKKNKHIIAFWFHMKQFHIKDYRVEN